LSSQNARRFRIEEKRGVVIVNVEPNSPADEAGLEPGDIISEINKESVKSVSDYQRIVASLKGNALIRTARGYFIVKEKSE